MLRRDFTKSNKEYLKSNRIPLIAIAIFLIVGIVIFSIFGLNGNFELNGYNEFTITVQEKKVDNFAKYQHEISKIVNSYDGKFDTMLVSGEGDDTKFVVRYLKDVKNKDIIEINKLVAEELDIDQANISEHVEVASSVNKSDYIYTAVAVLIIAVIATIFSYVRYNGASALSLLAGYALGTLGLISICAILRLSVGTSFFAMLVLLNTLITYFAINLFESMHKSSWLMSEDYASAMDNALKSSKFRMLAVTIGLMLIGILFVLFAPSPIKYVSLNIMFIAVILLAISWYVVPFVWNMLVPRCRKREYKVKATTKNVEEK